MSAAPTGAPASYVIQFDDDAFLGYIPVARAAS